MPRRCSTAKHEYTVDDIARKLSRVKYEKKPLLYERVLISTAEDT